jgi:hypothetical protein
MGLPPSNDLLSAHHVLVPADNRFQRASRLGQALWREKNGHPIGLHRGTPLGSRLAMPFAESTLANYLTDPIRQVFRAEVIDRLASSEQLYSEPRIFDDLLSSQPLCFNLFGELQCDLGLASRVVGDLTALDDVRVTAIRFEYSPGPGDRAFTGDYSAFDVFVEYESDGQRKFLGIEVKYVENMAQLPARLRPRYGEVARTMGCFRDDYLLELRAAPLEQLWRDHLLAGSLLAHPAGGFSEGTFVVLYPARNDAVADAVARYRACLRDDRSFRVWTLERFIASIRRHGGPWATELAERYLSDLSDYASAYRPL